MPELPEVETVVRALRPALSGRRIRELELHHPRVSRHSNPEFLSSVCKGATIETLERRGKFILFQLKNKPQLAVHLRMSGQLLLSEKPLDSPHIRATFHLDKGPNLYFVDIRTFGTIFLVDGSEPKGFRSLGIEPLSSGFTVKSFRSLLENRSTPIKTFLLMQERIAGIGNIYASEALWRAKIDPRTSAGDLSSHAIKRLHESLIQVLKDAVEQMGTTLSDFRRPDGEPGRYGNKLNVYGREEEPCFHCGKPIQRIVQNGRSTFFCPRCQHTPCSRRG